MKIYLDANIYCRPLDDHTQPRIALEAEACLVILEAIENQIITAVGSDILLYELQQADRFRQSYILPFARLWQTKIRLTSEVITQAKVLQKKLKLKSYDALHLSSAINAEADYLLTCDDQFVTKTNKLIRIKVLNPIDFIKKGTL